MHSSCSSVFNSILSNNGHVPYIYLRGIAKEEMESVLQFMYLGEATFYQERMNMFLNVAKDLDVKEIGKNVDAQERPEKLSNEVSESIEDIENVINDIPVVIEQSVDSRQTNTIEKLTDIGKFDCDHCPSVFSSRGSLWNHKRNKHEGVTYPCQQCDSKATQLGNLNTHIKTKHEGKKYPCGQCEYLGKSPASLYIHVKSKHKGICYPCQQCDYKSTTQSNLNAHTKSKH